MIQCLEPWPNQRREKGKVLDVRSSAYGQPGMTL